MSVESYFSRFSLIKSPKSWLMESYWWAECQCFYSITGFCAFAHAKYITAVIKPNELSWREGLWSRQNTPSPLDVCHRWWEILMVGKTVLDATSPLKMAALIVTYYMQQIYIKRKNTMTPLYYIARCIFGFG